MSTKDQLLKAREHILAKRYQEARDILYQIDHPTAQKWLAKVDELDPPDLPEDPFAPVTLESIPEPDPIPPAPDLFTTSNYQKQKSQKGKTIPLPLAIAIIGGFMAVCLCSGIGLWVYYQASETLGSVLADSEPILDLGSDFGSSIQYGDSVNGQLSDVFPLQNWRFSANEGDRVTITMRSTDFDALLELYDAEGYFLTEDDDSGGDFDAQIIYTIPSSGDYIITTTEWWSEVGIIGGNYTLTLQQQ
jgi:hypothetical protein